VAAGSAVGVVAVPTFLNCCHKVHVVMAVSNYRLLFKCNACDLRNVRATLYTLAQAQTLADDHLPRYHTYEGNRVEIRDLDTDNLIETRNGTYDAPEEGRPFVRKRDALTGVWEYVYTD
jgi:hypothetical protein